MVPLLDTVVFQTDNSVAILTAAVGAMLVSFFGIAGLLLRMAANHILAEIAKDHKEINAVLKEHGDRLEWTRTILAINRLIPQPADPNGR